MALNLSTENGIKMWVEKYRPQELDKIIANKNNIKTIEKFVTSKSLPNLLFYGSPGTGKTSTALVISKMLNGADSKHLTLELNASDSRGIDIVRKEIKSFAETGAIFSTGLKLIILDEADAMTNAAQFALRRVIERTSANVRFCFICNRINKIIPAIQSRCTKMRFSLLCDAEIVGCLKNIAEKEKIKYDVEGIKTIIGISKGDMRNCINVLQACWFGHGNVNEENVFKTTGIPSRLDMEEINNNLLNDSFDFCCKRLNDMQKNRGASLDIILSLLLERVLRTDFPAKTLTFLIEKMAQIESRVLTGSCEKIQAAALVAAFSMARKMALE